MCQKIVIRIMDVDDPKDPLKNAQEIGKVECTLGKLVGSPKGKFESPLTGKGGKEGTGHPCAPLCIPAACHLRTSDARRGYAMQ